MRHTRSVRAENIGYSFVDWVTLTYEEALQEEMMDTLSYLEKVLKNANYVWRPWRTSIASGDGIGPLKMGVLRTNPGVRIAILSGAYAPLLATWGLTGTKTTRIDFAVDVNLPVANEAYRDSYHELHRFIQSSKGKRGQTTYYDGAEGGWTFYHGRGSDGYKLRVYDKGAEQGLKAGKIIRFELQIGRRYANDARTKWLRSPNKQRWIKDCLVWYAQKNGIDASLLDGTATRFVPICRVDIGGNDRERMRTYMRKNVAPFVSRYLSVYGEQETLEELSLSHFWNYFTKSVTAICENN